MERAACRGLWHVMDAGPDDPAVTVATAKAICRDCPVTMPCLSWALGLPNRDDPGGTVAGTSEKERRRLRARVREQRRADGGEPVPEGMRRCQSCRRVLVMDRFDRTARGHGWWRSCRECRAKLAREDADRRVREAEERLERSQRAG